VIPFDYCNATLAGKHQFGTYRRRTGWVFFYP
jgi:hypothetical protein